MIQNELWRTATTGSFFMDLSKKFKKKKQTKKVQTKQTNAPKYPLIAYLHNLHFLCLCEIDTSGQCIIGRAHQLAAPRLDTETCQSWHHGPYPKKRSLKELLG